MKISLSILVLLLLAMPALATDYYLVPEKPADVVQGASYAAHMQATHGVSFSGITEETIAADPEEYRKEMLVFIDDDDVTIVQGEAAFNLVTTTKTYFSEANVETAVLSELYDYGAPETTDDEEMEEAEEREQPRPVCDGCDYGSNCLAEGTRSGSLYCDGEEMRQQLETGSDCRSSYECQTGTCQEGSCADSEPPAPEPKKERSGNIITKLFRWLGGLFS